MHISDVTEGKTKLPPCFHSPRQLMSNLYINHNAKIITLLKTLCGFWPGAFLNNGWEGNHFIAASVRKKNVNVCMYIIQLCIMYMHISSVIMQSMISKPCPAIHQF